ncbi:MAG TPA: hypothetical protein VN737_04135 [Bryobacteraceae bacterium]|nr:hypothetical protein [Bryobacteraceae bacterium]
MSTTPQPLPFFGRAWQVAVNTADGKTYSVQSTVADGEDPLRVTFKIENYALLAYWQAEVAIYNMEASIRNQVRGIQNLNDFWAFNQPLVAGDSLSLSAGYRAANSTQPFDVGANLLYAGKILQSAWTRENVTDYRLTLRCVTGLLEDALNFVSFSLSKGATAYDAVTQAAGHANIPVEHIDQAATDALKSSAFARGQAFHSRPFSTFRDLTKQNNLLAWVSPNGLNVRSFDPKTTPAAPNFAYAPVNLDTSQQQNRQTAIKETLIGTPEQTQDGVVFRVLLDSSVKIGDIVQLAAGTIVNLFPVQIGSLPPVPSRDGLYVVAGLKHVGDSRGRGDDWYTEVQGVTMDFFANFLQARNPLGKN